MNKIRRVGHAARMGKIRNIYDILVKERCGLDSSGSG
jgi:hypothetical protein